jgi:hypothetical protein
LTFRTSYPTVSKGPEDSLLTFWLHPGFLTVRLRRSDPFIGLIFADSEYLFIFSSGPSAIGKLADLLLGFP